MPIGVDHEEERRRTPSNNVGLITFDADRRWSRKAAA